MEPAILVSEGIFPEPNSGVVTFPGTTWRNRKSLNTAVLCINTSRCSFDNFAKAMSEGTNSVDTVLFFNNPWSRASLTALTNSWKSLSFSITVSRSPDDFGGLVSPVWPQRMVNAPASGLDWTAFGDRTLMICQP